MPKNANASYFPSRTSLAVAWALLITLTLGTMLTGRVTHQAKLALPLFSALMLVTWIKAGIILRSYLNLRTVPAAADTLTIVIGLILAVVTTLYVLAR